MRTCYLLLAIDISGSMSSCAKNVREAVMTYLRKIAEMNADAVDVRYKVKILFFNDSVREHSTEFLDPAQILEVLTESDFTCSGGTRIGKLFETLDRIFSRKGLIKDIDKGDPLPMFLAVSDLMETDSSAMEAASRDLYDNRFFHETNRLVLFVGPDDYRDAAVRLAKDEDHVMTISSALTAQLLAVFTRVKVMVSGTPAAVPLAVPTLLRMSRRTMPDSRSALATPWLLELVPSPG